MLAMWAKMSTLKAMHKKKQKQDKFNRELLIAILTASCESSFRSSGMYCENPNILLVLGIMETCITFTMHFIRITAMQ